MIYFKKNDPFTGQEFIPTRHNQKFANRKNQIAFNNAKARRIRREKAPHDKKFEKNRRILKNVLGSKDKITMSTDYLIGAGFDFNYFNGVVIKNEKIYYKVYNYAIRHLSKKMCELKKFNRA